MNDALYQLFHLPSLLVRLLGPETVAYNLWVALPIPLSALGMYLFLRRQLSPLIRQRPSARWYSSKSARRHPLVLHPGS